MTLKDPTAAVEAITRQIAAIDAEAANVRQQAQQLAGQMAAAQERLKGLTEERQRWADLLEGDG